MFDLRDKLIERSALFGGCGCALKRAQVLFCRISQASNLFGLVGLLGQKHSLDVGEDTTLGDGHSGEKLVQLLVVPDGQLQVTGDDPGLLVVTGGVSCKLENLSCQVLHDGGQVHGGTGSDPLGVVALPQETVDTSHGELQTSTAGASLALALGFSSLTTSRHLDLLLEILTMLKICPFQTLNTSAGVNRRPDQSEAVLTGSCNYKKTGSDVTMPITKNHFRDQYQLT